MSTIRYCIVIVCLVMLSGFAGATVLPPVADFTANVTSGTAPLPVKFTDNSLYATGWAWYFGDETYTQAWTLVNASSGWAARTFHSTVLMKNGRIVLMGGIDKGNKYKNDTWWSSNNGAMWTLVNASSGWAARYQHSSVALPDDSIVLTGGQSWDGVDHYYNDTWRSTDQGATWTLVNASPGWAARYDHTSVALPDGSIVLTGGQLGSSGGLLNDTWRSTDQGATWTRVNASSGWSKRFTHSTVALPDGSIVLTGGLGASNKNYNDTWRSIDQGATWTLVNASSGWTARYGHSSVVMPDGSIVLMGGMAESLTTNDTWRSTDKGATWTRVNASAGWPARGYPRCVVMPDSSIVLMGGYDGSRMNDTWRFQPVGSSVQNPVHTYTTPGIYTIALQAYNINGYNSTRKVGYIHVTNGLDKIGVFRNGHGWYLDSSGNGAWNSGEDTTYGFGMSGDVPVTGDWNHDGKTEIGVFRNGHGWYLDSSGNGAWNSGEDTTYGFGMSGDVPVTGDWNHDGTTEIGVFRNGHGWYLDSSGNGAWNSGEDTTYGFGMSGDKPVTGKWTNL